MPTLRPYQQRLEDDIDTAWAAGAKTVLAIAPTGAGKTVLFTNILARERGASAAIAHRRELVTQMSLALARNGVRHRVVGPKSVARAAAGMHIDELGRSYIDPHARCGVVGIDSLPGLKSNDPWLSQVQTWVGDEGHHFLRENKWGQGVSLFPNARGLLVTATGFRSDGQGLGRGIPLPGGKWTNDGLAEAIVQGPTMAQLIDMGYLTDYSIFCPPSDIDYSAVPVTSSGDLSPSKLRAVVHKSTRIVGDVVSHYLAHAAGKLGVTFAVDVDAATELAAAYRAAGVPAEVVSAKTPDLLRQRILTRFRRREVLQLVNVDLFGEGFDLPAIEVVSMVRKTESKGLFDQQFGRALRLMVDDRHAQRWDSYSDAERRGIVAASGKPKAIIIDHVGNVVRHKPPDALRFHTLDRRERRAKARPGDEIPLTVCLNVTCMKPYPRDQAVCPWCGQKPSLLPAQRRMPEFVDGDLIELDSAALAELRGGIERVDRAASIPPGLSGPAQQHLRNAHHARQMAQKSLRDAIALWAGRQKHEGATDSEIYRRFWFTFGTDVLSAQALSRADAEKLAEAIHDRNTLDGTVSTE